MASKSRKTASRKASTSKNANASTIGTSTLALGIDLSQLEQVLQLMGKHKVSELEWENAEARLILKTGEGLQRLGLPAALPQVLAPPASPLPPIAPTPAAPAAERAPAPASAASNLKQVLSPFVGTFYRSASPTAEPYVREGQRVKRGDTLCIIEAMKLMNEIEAELEGKIVKVLVENGQPVEFGEPLFSVEV